MAHTLSLFTVLVLAGCMATSSCTPENVTSPHLGDSIHVVWKTPASDKSAVRGAAVTDSVRLYAQVDGISAYDLETGARRWQTSEVFAGSRSIAVHAGRVFTSEGIARALDAATGVELWRFTPDTLADFALSAVDERAFYIGSRANTLYALDVTTGQPFWAVSPLEQIRYSAMIEGIIVSGDTVYAGITDDTSPTGHLKRGWIVALDRHTGQVLWRYVNERKDEAHDAGDHAVAGRMLLVNDRRGDAFFGLDRFTGREVWRHAGRPDLFGAWDIFKVADGVAYLASNDTYAYAFDPETGHIHWKTYLRASANSSAVCGNYVFAAVGLLYKLQRSDGAVQAIHFADWQGVVGDEWVRSRLLAHGNRVYFVGNKAVYAVACE